ncbi:tRNA (adenosine(37)-N6)-threonylcarbamoyltransferase complex ATPase subunit type 1 TsaE [Paenibacillus thermotolerans]|uniref:tRNA (adenosine(37)-N6)-threonylcarbamoyltransferase complex ATPase subunit type 1 TsaE n=1 Tax=Paenibacillus thermotolerans TaxID=3027807 RepID=UPI00236884A5|nr:MULTISPECIES: tRNA (adenosine(37)-N6)-threonylcarbamoyltransferase complex ATPase subunit type 1 TsaE [unclassified Paenibacillus]
MSEAGKTYRYYAESEIATERLAKHLAMRMGPGYVLALDGDLGAGKTRFSQAVAKALGVKESVNSPTFTIIKEYKGEKLPFYHMDVYRISAEEADELGLDDYFFGDGVTVVEWASIIQELLPPERLDVYISVQGATEREFAITPHGTGHKVWCEKLAEMKVLASE